MTVPVAEPFPDNWSYIKTELNWLDRVLVMAVGRHRRDLKETEGMTRNARDRVTRHWWKGVITLDQSPNYDEYRPGAAPDLTPPQSGNAPPQGAAPSQGSSTPPANSAPNSGGRSIPPLTYQEQLAARIQASRQQGVLLGLPALEERLGLTTFEKNLVLLSLAPEVNRRFSRLYGVLQESDHQERPLVDLAFKLFCRNDQEWQAARLRLGTQSPLVQYGFVTFVNESDQPLLTQTLKLTDTFVNFLLAEHLDTAWLDRLLDSHLKLELEATTGLLGRERSSPVSPSLAERSPDPVSTLHPTPAMPSQSLGLGDLWAQLVLPQPTLDRLEKVVLRLRLNGNPTGITGKPDSGRLLLIHGPKGTGKTLIAQALAQRLELPLYRFNLRHYSPEQYGALLQLLRSLPTAVTLLEPCGLWLGRRSPLLSLGLLEWIHQQQAKGGLMIAEGEFAVPLPLAVRRSVDEQLSLALPNATERLQLWKQAFAREMALDLSVDWQSFWAKLSHQYRLSGADIAHLAREAGHQAQVAGELMITPRHLQAVLKTYVSNAR
ncbi:MAG: AAA family ATPase [Prochlorotrichaceae cyanobacterium]|jgi:hypothetical protein